MSEIQPYELEQLRLVGIVSGTTAPSAMFEGPNGEPYPLTVGALIGRRWAKVVRITERCVDLQERLRDYDGAVTVHKLQIGLESKGPELGG